MQKRTLVSFDWALKKLLRQKANYGILEGFLSELLRFDVTIENILDSESNKVDQDLKINRVDILAQDSDKRLYIIELQCDKNQQLRRCCQRHARRMDLLF